MDQLGIARVVAELAKKAERDAATAQRRALDEMVKTQIEILGAVFDRAIAYTNVIIIAGYAGFFGLWQLTKGMIPTTLALWAALLMTMSVVVFVMFEVWKMYMTNKDLRRLNEITTSPETTKSPEAFHSALRGYQSDSQAKLAEVGRVWLRVLAVTVVTGLGAAGLLMAGFVYALATS